jgi:hypothetical protein
MDTDELTEMAYECLRIAESTCHTLNLVFGAMSDHFNNEDEYLKGILKRLKIFSGTSMYPSGQRGWRFSGATPRRFV